MLTAHFVTGLQSSMAKVSISAGFTIHIGNPALNEFGKISVEVTDIDTEAPIEPQLEKMGTALEKTWEALRKKVDAVATDTVGVQVVRRGQN